MRISMCTVHVACGVEPEVGSRGCSLGGLCRNMRIQCRYGSCEGKGKQCEWAEFGATIRSFAMLSAGNNVGGDL